MTLACLLPPASTRAQNAYITNLLSNTVSVIDTATDTTIATIPVRLGPFGVAVSPDGTKVYVTSLSGGTMETLRHKVSASHRNGTSISMLRAVGADATILTGLDLS